MTRGIVFTSTRVPGLLQPPYVRSSLRHRSAHAQPDRAHRPSPERPDDLRPLRQHQPYPLLGRRDSLRHRRVHGSAPPSLQGRDGSGSRRSGRKIALPSASARRLRLQALKGVPGAFCAGRIGVYPELATVRCRARECSYAHAVQSGLAMRAPTSGKRCRFPREERSPQARRRRSLRRAGLCRSAIERSGRARGRASPPQCGW